MRKAYFVITILLLVAVVVQFYFAALGVFGPRDPEDLFVFHRTNAQIVIPGLILLGIIFAALSRAGARTVLLSALPIALIALQYVLFILSGVLTGDTPENPTVGGAIILGLHALVGLSVLGNVLELVRRARARAFASDAGTPVDDKPAAPA